METKIMVLAPHPDDETIGCGGALLRHIFNGDHLWWIIMTSISKNMDYSTEQIKTREREISLVSKKYGFISTEQLGFPTTCLDMLPLGDLVNSVGDEVRKIAPEIIYVPFPGDVHSDHGVSFKVIESCSKWFRYPSIKRILAYETLSETEFGIHPFNNNFCPNCYVDITDFLERKIEIMKIYQSEIESFPFPRSEKSIRSLAAFRGSSSGYEAAEAFMLLRERY